MVAVKIIPTSKKTKKKKWCFSGLKTTMFTTQNTSFSVLINLAKLWHNAWPLQRKRPLNETEYSSKLKKSEKQPAVLLLILVQNDEKRK